MSVLILGGAGFVGLNIAHALVAAGRDVTVFDRIEPPPSATVALAGGPGRFASAIGDVTDAAALQAVLRPGFDALVMGAAVTADAAREARDPETILRVNLLSLVPALEAARAAGVRRIVNLSSAAAYGRAAERGDPLTEAGPADPVGLYGITKYASERVADRLADLWGMDVVSVRLSAVFGPWERATGSRDTLSPQLQLMTLARKGEPALLERPGRRDWIYAPDVAEAVLSLIEAPRPPSRLYNVSSPSVWSVVEWGQRLSAAHPGFVCRVAEPGEAANVALHAPGDRAPLATDRLRDELGWEARFGLADSADHLVRWWRDHGAGMEAE